MDYNWSITGAEREAETGLWQGGQEPTMLLKSERDIAWDAAQLMFKCLSPGGNVYISLDPWHIEVDGNNGRIYLGKCVPGSFYEAWDFQSGPGDWLDIEVAVEATGVTVKVNGQAFRYEAGSKSLLTSARIYFCPASRFGDPEITVNEVPEPFPAAPGEVKQNALEFTVDFYDDLHYAAFDQPMLDTMFRTMAELGASRSYWIHHGGRESLLWESSARSENMRRSFDALGDDYLPAAVQASHKAGLPFVGILKPFDTAIGHYTFPVPKGQGKPDALGGRLWQVFKFPSQHPELCLQRRTQPAPQKAVGQILIRSRKSIDAETAQGIEIYVSEDNATYRAYEGRFEIEATGDEIRLSGLEITELFIAVVFQDALVPHLQNALPQLATVTDAEGCALDFTYGIHGRKRRMAIDHLEVRTEELDFREHGLDFDCAGDTMPSANCAPRHRLLELFSLKQSHGVLGLAMTSNPQVPGICSEAEPAVHDWWLSVLDEMMDDGADGVEIRLMNHGNIIDWEQYGFNDQVVDEYRRRWGVDIRSEEFCREKFQQLRGEFFTDFLRRASALARRRGCRFYLHIEDTHQGPADEPCPMGIYTPWRAWITEGLCDGVTFKAVDFRAHETAFGRELFALCRERNIPVSYTPFIHIASVSNLSEELFESLLASECDALNLYEFSSLFKFTADGAVQTFDEKLIAWLKTYMWKKEGALSKVTA